MEPDGLDFEALKKLGLSNADVDFVREKTLVYNQLITGTVTVTPRPGIGDLHSKSGLPAWNRPRNREGEGINQGWKKNWVLTDQKHMATRNSANDINLLREQYKRLANAVDGFYAGEEFQALNIAVTLRLLVHTTRKSRALLSRVDRKYWDLTIQHRPLDPKVVFSVPITLR